MPGIEGAAVWTRERDPVLEREYAENIRYKDFFVRRAIYLAMLGLFLCVIVAIAVMATALRWRAVWTIVYVLLGVWLLLCVVCWVSLSYI